MDPCLRQKGPCLHTFRSKKNPAATWLGGKVRAPTAIDPGGRGHAPERHRAHETPDQESCGGKGYVPNPVATWLEGRVCTPTAIGLGGRGHALERHWAHEVPLAGNPTELRAVCLTLRQPGSEAEPVRLRQPALEAGAMCQKGVGPTRPPTCVPNPAAI
ncbi:hypothetical protein AAC387_Pa02g1876 [Persea americana]